MRTHLFVALVLVLGLVGCGDKGPTAPNGDTPLEVISGGLSVTVTTQQYRFIGEEGMTVAPSDLISVEARFHGRGDQPFSKPVMASIVFTFEDGTNYDNHALVYGPFLGGSTGEFQLNGAFRVQDGLWEVAAKKPGQLIACWIRFDNGPAGNGQTFRVIGFYIRQ